jgi:glucosamine--fructose-6-phosphate aminotransferase (isomerizing)
MSLTQDEIDSQPAVWETALAVAESAGAMLAAPGERLLIVGCGTSAFVASSLAALRESAGLGETDAAYASELPVGRKYDRVVAITRSGTTTEVIEALARYGSSTRRCVITAVAGMPADAFADDVLVLGFADEESVVQTRFPTTVLLLGRAAFGVDVTGLPDACRGAIAAPLPVRVDEVDHFVYLGRGWTIGLASEAALKVREAAQAWSESYPAMDYRHGPIGIAGERSAVFIFGAAPARLVVDVEATGASVVTSDDDPLVQLVTAQRIAVALAAHRGLDPDRPRGLSRSVILG